MTSSSRFSGVWTDRHYLYSLEDYFVEDLEEMELQRLFEAAMPCLELQDRLTILGT